MALPARGAVRVACGPAHAKAARDADRPALKSGSLRRDILPAVPLRPGPPQHLDTVASFSAQTRYFENGSNQYLSRSSAKPEIPDGTKLLPALSVQQEQQAMDNLCVRGRSAARRKRMPVSDVINLNRHRKRAARAQAEQKAAERRLAFGRTKAQRELDAAAERLKDRSLDGHLRIREDDT